jgi:hypothetical protein
LALTRIQDPKTWIGFDVSPGLLKSSAENLNVSGTEDTALKFKRTHGFGRANHLAKCRFGRDFGKYLGRHHELSMIPQHPCPREIISE